MDSLVRFILFTIVIASISTEAIAQRRGRNNYRAGRINNSRNRIIPPVQRRSFVRPNQRNFRQNRSPIFRNMQRPRLVFQNRAAVNRYRHMNRRFAYTRNYYGWLRNNHSNFFYRNWVLFPTARGNGFFLNQNYPYFVFNGYQHRYSGYDRCNYQLVDSYSNVSVSSYFNQICNIGYNSCAISRNNLNRSEFSNRYYCAESFR